MSKAPRDAKRSPRDVFDGAPVTGWPQRARLAMEPSLIVRHMRPAGRRFASSPGCPRPSPYLSLPYVTRTADFHVFNSELCLTYGSTTNTAPMKSFQKECPELRATDMTGPVEMSCTNRIVVGIQQFTNQKVGHARINVSDRPKWIHLHVPNKREDAPSPTSATIHLLSSSSRSRHEGRQT